MPKGKTIVHNYFNVCRFFWMKLKFLNRQQLHNYVLMYKQSGLTNWCCLVL